jgi:hypothetical protein
MRLNLCNRFSNLWYNFELLWDTGSKRVLFDYLYAKSNERLLDVFDVDDIYGEIIRKDPCIYPLNAYILAAEFYGEMANYSKGDIKMLRRLSM